MSRSRIAALRSREVAFHTISQGAGGLRPVHCLVGSKETEFVRRGQLIPQGEVPRDAFRAETLEGLSSPMPTRLGRVEHDDQRICLPYLPQGLTFGSDRKLMSFS